VVMCDVCGSSFCIYVHRTSITLARVAGQWGGRACTQHIHQGSDGISEEVGPVAHQPTHELITARQWCQKTHLCARNRKIKTCWMEGIPEH
jgi:hypothetical protein